MTHGTRCMRRLAWAGVGLALVLGGLASQAYAQGGDADAAPGLACGIVDARPAMVAYYTDLCRAFSVALEVGSTDLWVGSSEDVLRALLDGSVQIALGLPWEGTGEAAVRHGPVVLVMPFGRFGLAARRGDDRTLDTASWLFHALVEAEARGIGRDAVAADLATVSDAAADAFRTYEDRLTSQLGLPSDAIRSMIERHGHHGEIYAEWFGDPSDANRPVELGGQLYAPPVSDR